ncbi:hypothetical protein BGZ63DRAFT_397318 [Mariannaea sp. PMI_226]|nr:hypothetical protein BGZ63DRAFT_397318 [Mariannaea sp. PMI_226]
MASYMAENNPFANLFLVVQNGTHQVQAPALEAVGFSEQPRKKRAHRKSRHGCVACKRRRVKCDEQIPCSNCSRRAEKCLRPAQQSRAGSIPQSLSNPKFEASKEPELNLLHLELFSHFEKQTWPTLSFPKIWPALMQQAFHEEFVMTAMLCVSATHLAYLNPADPRYPHASAQLLPKSLRLLRHALSQPFTSKNALALLGTSLLMGYMSWSDLSFLNHSPIPSKDGHSLLDLSQDQLYLLSPGVLQVYFQVLPILVAEGDGYGHLGHQRPRLRIEKALASQGENPARFLTHFMEVWDDARFQPPPSSQITKTTNGGGTTPRSWLFYLELKAKLDHLDNPQLPSQNEMPSPTPMELAKAITEINTPETHNRVAVACAENRVQIGPTTDDNNNSKIAPATTSVYATSRSSYGQMARRLSPLLCCVSHVEDADPTSPAHAATLKSMTSEFRQMFFSFPILYCWPFLELVMGGDSRALVLLCHFYRAARVLLAAEDSWWSHKRSRVMEQLIANELAARGLDLYPLTIECA